MYHERKDVERCPMVMTAVPGRRRFCTWLKNLWHLVEKPEQEERQNIERVFTEYRASNEKKRLDMWLLYIELRRCFDEMEEDLKGC